MTSKRVRGFCADCNKHVWFDKGACENCREARKDRILLTTAVLLFVLSVMALIYRDIIYKTVSNAAGNAQVIADEIQGKYVHVVNSGNSVDVSATVRTTQSVTLSFPDSDYTSSFNLDLGSDFVDQTDPAWWTRVLREVEQLHCEERDLCPEKYFIYQIIINGDDEETEYNIKVMPTAGWLENNVKVYVNKPFTYVMIDLPETGEMRKVADEDGYLDYVDSYRYDPEELEILSLMQLDTGETYIYSTWHIRDYLEDDHRYFMETLEDLQELPTKSLLYSYGDGRYLVLHLPVDLLNLTDEDLSVGDQVFILSGDEYVEE